MHNVLPRRTASREDWTSGKSATASYLDIFKFMNTENTNGIEQCEINCSRSTVSYAEETLF